MEQILEDNDHSAALDEDENDVAMDTGEKPEEYETGDDWLSILWHHFGQGGS